MHPGGLAASPLSAEWNHGVAPSPVTSAESLLFFPPLALETDIWYLLLLHYKNDAGLVLDIQRGRKHRPTRYSRNDSPSR